MKTLAANVLALSLGLAVSVSAQAVTADDLQKQIDAQQRTMLEMQNRITELTTQVNTLRGDLEQLRYQIARTPSGSSAQTAAAETAPAAPQTSSVPVAASAQTSVAPAASSSSESLVLKPVDAAAQSEYDAAYALVVANQLSQAEGAFTTYLNKYSDNTLTPNAWYWLAQAQYKLNKLDEARVSFLNVARFTSSTKRPDALYKLGLISNLRGEKDKAAAYFNLVIKTYPADTSADMARKELASL